MKTSNGPVLVVAKTCPACGQLFFLGYQEQEKCDNCLGKKKKLSSLLGRLKPDGKLRPPKKETK